MEDRPERAIPQPEAQGQPAESADEATELAIGDIVETAQEAAPPTTSPPIVPQETPPAEPAPEALAIEPEVALPISPEPTAPGPAPEAAAEPVAAGVEEQVAGPSDQPASEPELPVVEAVQPPAEPVAAGVEEQVAGPSDQPASEPELPVVEAVQPPAELVQSDAEEETAVPMATERAKGTEEPAAAVVPPASEPTEPAEAPAKRIAPADAAAAALMASAITSEAIEAALEEKGDLAPEEPEEPEVVRRRDKARAEAEAARTEAPARPPKPSGPRMADLRPGTVVKGTVTRIERYGAFVNLGLAERRDGLIHISELSPYRIRRVEDVVQVGSQVEARVVSVDLERGRIALSLNDVETAVIPEVAASHEPTTTSMAAAFERAFGRKREEDARQRGGAGKDDMGSRKRREHEALMDRLRSGGR